MKTTILTITALFFTLLSFSQDESFQWAKSIGGTGNDTGNSVMVDGTGNIYTTGSFSGTVDFDPSSAVYNLVGGGIFISKFDALGNFIWAKNFSSSASITSSVLKNNNIYITGNFLGTVDFDPSSAVSNLTSIGGSDIFVTKFDLSGNFQWVKSIGGTGSDNVSSIAVDDNGNVFTTGVFEGIADFDPSNGVYNLTSIGTSDFFISKLTASGDFSWAIRIGTDDVNDPNAHELVLSISLDGNGNVYTSGQFLNTTDFDPGTGIFNLTGSHQYQNKFNWGIFILKLDNFGNFIWAKERDYTVNSIVNSNGNIYSYQNGYVSKLDTFGDYIWQKSFTSRPTISFISTDISGNVYVTGSFTGTIDFDPGAGVYNLTATTGGEIFMIKLTSSGDFSWAKKYKGSSSKITTDGIGNIYIAGSFGGIVDFDTGAGILNLTSTNSSSDIYLLKFSSCSSQITSFTTQQTNIKCYGANNGLVTVKPNVTSNSLMYSSDDGITFQTSNLFNGLVPKDYSLIIKDVNNCISTSQLITITEPVDSLVPVTNICLVTIANNKNQIVWEKDLNHKIIKYKIYKQNNATSNYDFIHEQAVTALSEYLDTSSTPNTQIARYKLMVVDSCGFESPLSSNHTTILLSSNLGTNNTVNLNWNAYEGFVYSNFEIWRSLDGVNYTLLSTVANNTFSYIDVNPNTQGYYQIRITNPNGCTSSKSSFSTASSNIIDKSGHAAGLTENSLDALVSFFPNPTKGSFKITSSLDIINSIQVFDNLGKIVYSNHEISNEKDHSIDLFNCTEGIYTVKVISDSKIITSKIALQR